MTDHMTEEALRAFGFEKIDRDLQFLLECFGEMLEGLGEKNLAACLPWSREFPPAGKMQEQLLQVYSIAFQLLNLVEENTAAQVRRMRETSFGLHAESGLWGNRLHDLVRCGFTQKQIAAILPSVRVEPVLTAHPTEAKRTSVLEQHRDLYTLLRKRENDMLTPAEQRGIRREILATLERLWRTGETLLDKPGVATERSAILHYLRDVFPAVLHQIDLRLEESWENAGFDLAHINEPSTRPRLRFGCWVGGDRDGHPLITAHVTAETLRELRLNALLVVRKQLHEARANLSLSSGVQAAPPELVTRLRQLRLETGADVPEEERHHEPWREFLTLVEAKLPLDVEHGRHALLREKATSYRMVHQLEKDLHLLRDSLVSIGAGRLAAADLHPLLRTLDVFGFHLAALDVRQNSRFHELAVAQLIDAAGMSGKWFLKAGEKERLDFLLRELQSPRPFTLPETSAGPEADAVLGCYRVLVTHIENYGPDGLGALIVSMTRNVSDLLIVYLLARETGLARTTEEGLVCLLPVVPLFETIQDLEAAPGIMNAFLAHPMTERSLRIQQKNRHRAYQGSLRRAVRSSGLVQQVMIGYSDSNKDSGILASQWILQRSQEKQTRIADGYGIKLRFFHGRGGTISRGAGPTHRFLEALPHGTANGDIRLTEQGETISQKYNNISTATYNIELLLAGVTDVTVKDSAATSHPEAPAPTLDMLAQWSRETYRALLEEPDFLEFYGQATPIDALEISGIGSRPSRRTGRRSLEDLRAIPWVFSWTQSRFYLPGWYGVGAALSRLKKEDPAAFDQLREGLKAWPFVNYLITNVGTSLASANAVIMRSYAGLVRDVEIRDRFMNRIEGEFRLTRRMLEELYGGKTLDSRPRMAKTLALREHPLQGLHAHQIRLLQKWRTLQAKGRTAEANRLRPHLLLSVNAIASGLRTTG